ncbi:MAG: hypothetical protein ACXVZR_14925 [Terriglobales bacterium]
MPQAMADRVRRPSPFATAPLPTKLAPSDLTGLAPDFSLVVTPDLKYYAYSYLPSISQLHLVSGWR